MHRRGGCTCVCGCLHESLSPSRSLSRKRGSVWQEGEVIRCGAARAAAHIGSFFSALHPLSFFFCLVRTRVCPSLLHCLFRAREAEKNARISHYTQTHRPSATETRNV